MSHLDMVYGEDDIPGKQVLCSAIRPYWPRPLTGNWPSSRTASGSLDSQHCSSYSWTGKT